MDLFTQVDDIRITKLDATDIELQTDKYLLLKSLLGEHELMYPSILKWFKEKVEPGIKIGQRTAYIGFNNDIPIASAVVKIGRVSKFCHLSIKENFKNQNIGELFFAMMALDVKRQAEEIYFTLPENLWETKEQFFKSFGFKEVSHSPTQYRKFENELISKAPFDLVWRNSLRKLPKIITAQINSSESIFSGILMSINPKFVDKILNKGKVVEIRKQFHKQYEGCRVTLYATHPSKQVCGYAKVEHVKHDSADNIWQQYESLLGCTKAEFDKYTGGREKVYAIFLTNVEPYKVPIPLTQLNYWLDENIAPPQSYYKLENNQHWAKAISIAEMLQGRFRTFTQLV
jgi:predicted transcriptional regulator